MKQIIILNENWNTELEVNSSQWHCMMDLNFVSNNNEANVSDLIANFGQDVGGISYYETYLPTLELMGYIKIII